MQNYDLGALTRDQKQALNKMKMVTRKENEIYLKSHPEIRGFISILLRYTCHRGIYIQFMPLFYNYNYFIKNL